MASIFTFDPDPPRVSSPWHASARQSPKPSTAQPSSEGKTDQLLGQEMGYGGPGCADDLNVTRLDAEPQDGPTEYKLHLLLRPRRLYSSRSSNSLASGSHHSKIAPSTPRGTLEIRCDYSPPLAQSCASRQHRLEQLTTQLLWRLQQSSPFHSSSTTNLILPSLPETATELDAPKEPAKLIPGLEESKGALYEIGVSDDGTFVGLTHDEMSESLNNLRAMAASLGCVVDIQRMVLVGDAEWMEEYGPETVLRAGKLYVAEAYVKPELRYYQRAQESPAPMSALRGRSQSGHPASTNVGNAMDIAPPEEQLRVSFTGATTSGKSTLLGTLSTSTLDNGRGKSRLSLLKHRHEIASGMTSSVAQELIGYCDASATHPAALTTQVINYATENVSSWNDIHASSNPGRLAFLSDSAGHLRYRRTTVRGLVGWKPHWTILCIAANDGAEPSTQGASSPSASDSSPFAGAGAHLSIAHLDLCLRLQLPLIVVITKLDAATKASFRQILSTLLSFLKSAERKPILLPNDNSAIDEADLQTIPTSDANEVTRVINMLHDNEFEIVPILFTSAVMGTGIGKLHALLRYLPIPGFEQIHRNEAIDSTPFQNFPTVLFHIDDTYSLTAENTSGLNDSTPPTSQGSIICGRLAVGKISIGDELLLGPFSYSACAGSDDSDNPPASDSSDLFLTPRSFADALAKAISSPKARVMPLEREWRRVKVTSIRNLRLPVRALSKDQVGTVAIVPLGPASKSVPLPIRKGMVLANGHPSSVHTFTASFDGNDATSFTVGSLVVVYCASVRTSAKVVAIAMQKDPDNNPYKQSSMTDDDAECGFRFTSDEEAGPAKTYGEDGSILVTLQFVTYREWVEIGERVLIMLGGGPGLHGGTERGVKGVGGLDGFVGTIIERYI